MSDIREVIKNELLKRIKDAPGSDGIYWAVRNFREFAVALSIEAEAKLREKEVKK